MQETNEIKKDLGSVLLEKCTENGITDPKKIKKIAEKKINEINSNIEQLLANKTSLIAVIKSFGLESFSSNPVKRKTCLLTENTKAEELDEKQNLYAVQICNYIEKNKTATPRQLMDYCNITADKDFEIYSIIKWLGITGICERDENNKLIKSLNWENRPKTKE